MKQTLDKYIPSPTLAVAASYHPDSFSGTEVYICGAEIDEFDHIKLTFPKGHNLVANQLLTLHLDNRTGVAEYDALLSVFRLSYKGRVIRTSECTVFIEPVEFQVIYGLSVEYEYKETGYKFPDDSRQALALPITTLETLPAIDDNEAENKVGVLITKAQNQPHTTVMAFLSTKEDDIFFITFPNTFKSKLLKRNNTCYFAIDNRATFTFEEAIEWNYSIIQGKAYDIPKATPLFEAVKETFIAKNPWEVGFFSNPDVEMFHLKAEKVMCPGRKK